MAEAALLILVRAMLDSIEARLGAPVDPVEAVPEGVGQAFARIDALLEETEAASGRQVDVEEIRALVEQRRLARRVGGGRIAGWDMLIELVAAHLDGRHVSLAELGSAAGLAPAAARRWLRTWRVVGMVETRSHPENGRRRIVLLSEPATRALSARLRQSPAQKRR